MPCGAHRNGDKILGHLDLLCLGIGDMVSHLEESFIPHDFQYGGVPLTCLDLEWLMIQHEIFDYGFVFLLSDVLQ